jgi:hypothetical protein
MQRPIDFESPIPMSIRWDKIPRNNNGHVFQAPLIDNHDSLSIEVGNTFPYSTYAYIAKSKEPFMQKEFRIDKAFQEGHNQTLAALLHYHEKDINYYHLSPPLESAHTFSADKIVSLNQVDRNTNHKLQEKPKSEINLPMYLALRRNKCNRKYIDVSSWEDPVGINEIRGGVIDPFPEKLHRMLREVEMNGQGCIASFFLHGRAFSVNNRERFVTEILPKYLGLNRFSSFQRQLNLYGFVRIRSGPDKGGYYHELFLKGRPLLCTYMRRVKNVTSLIQDETSRRSKAPDFYRMEPSLLRIKNNNQDNDDKIIKNVISDDDEKILLNYHFRKSEFYVKNAT